MISSGEPSRELMVPAVKEPVSLTPKDNKVQMEPFFFLGLKGNHWLGVSQSQTPMQSYTSLTQCPLQGRQLIKRHNTRLPNTPNWQAYTCSTPLP